LSYVPAEVLSNVNVYGQYFLVTLRVLRNYRRPPLPPQFAMVWVPGVDLLPLSYAVASGRIVGFFYKVVGEGTKALSTRSRGDVVGVSEPLGRWYIPGGRDVVFLAGGAGIAPFLLYLEYVEEPRGLWGVRQGELAARLTKLFPKLGKLTVTSEDCTYGLCGKLTDHLDRVTVGRDTEVLVSGPSDMIREVCRRFRDLGLGRVGVVAESMVKCGIGACGSCLVGNVLLCREGPVVGCEHFG
jgi:dihydroorotate dehydrogenase electron transfer subunit